MSFLKYQKVLNIAEALLRKVDLPFETIQKYEELKLKILSETENFEEVTSQEETYKALKSEIQIKEHFINILIDYVDILTTSSINISEVSSNLFELHATPSNQYFEVISDKALHEFSQRISTLATKLTPYLTPLKPISSIPISSYITTMVSSLNTKLFKPIENF